MLTRGYNQIICLLLLSFVFTKTATAQSSGLCPPNIDFEYGDFTNWECRTGTVTSDGRDEIIRWTGFVQMFNRHTIIPGNSGLMDPYGGFPQSCPNGSGFSVKLGNNQVGAQAEGLFYTYHIPDAVVNFSLLYQYAVVFQDPQHPPSEQPRFRARVVDADNETELGCVSFDFTASASLPGFVQSPVDGSVYYKDWTPVTLNLNGYGGKTIRVEFITNDCTRGGHFGYAYVDVNSMCSGAVTGTTICEGENSVTLNAPYGFQDYKWYSDNTFSTLISSTQSLFLSPAPTVGNVYPIIVTPYQGFGCIDTLYGTITTARKPPSDAGPDKISCSLAPVQLGSAPDPAFGYAWYPAPLLDNAAISNPVATVTASGPQRFVLRTTDLITGCYAFDTTYVTPVIVDTTMNVAGKLQYCNNENVNTSFTIPNPTATWQWYQGTTALPVLNTSYQPTISGVYWAKMMQDGCEDSTRKVELNIYPLPVPDFDPGKDVQCITNNVYTLANSSTISNGDAMTYVWKFSDGGTSQDASPVKTFISTGTYSIKLISTSQHQCIDSIEKTVTVLPNASPDFSWDLICVNRAGTFTNLSNENASAQVKYVWDFKNGNSSSSKNPPMISYANPGTYNVSLTVVAIGCETAPQTVLKDVKINAPVKGIRYKDVTTPMGYTTVIKARDSIGANYTWQPQKQLSSYTVQNPTFTATDDVKYTITMTDGNTCTTTDTIQMLVLKKEGYYLPSAFTPNGDGLNDVIKPYLIGMKSLRKFSVYNRSGNLVFVSEKEGQSWDGTYKGIKLDTGVFVFLLEYIDSHDKLVVAKGTITLIR